MKTAQTVSEVVAFCRKEGIYLYPKTRCSLHAFVPQDQGHSDLSELAKCSPLPIPRGMQERPSSPTDGLHPNPSGLLVPKELISSLNSELSNPESEVSKRSVVPVERTFLYVDISGYGQMPPGIQLLAVTDLLDLVTNPIHWKTVAHVSPLREHALADLEVCLCIGDGYICVFGNAVWATYFAANLAYMIDTRNSEPEPAPFVQFHYRMGLHCGPVRRFWDQTHWNYTGDGINGGQRVISVIEPTLDDVVFVSESVVKEVRRQSLVLGQPGTKEEDLQATASDIKPELINRGRRMAKHQEEWRVYQLNHTEVAEW